MNAVGFSLLNGFGVKKDVVAAVPWLQQAADFGQPNAMHTLGILYRNGIGVQTDPRLSYEWLSLAVEHYGPDENARRQVAQLMILDTKLSDADRAEAEGWRTHWRPREHVRPEEQAPPKKNQPGPPPPVGSI